MATAVALPQAEVSVVPTVRTCYDVLDVARVCGITDLTDGIYVDDHNDRAAYLAAQHRQAEFLLDQVHCGLGTRLLDIGCGYGRILEQGAARGARPIGISISPVQVANDRARGLAVHELNYRNIFRRDDDSWESAFDAVVANGSLEHFVQVEDAAAGRADEIYEEMFSICRRLLVDGGRFVTTAIHFREVGQFDPHEISRGSHAHQRGSDNYQWATLVEVFGGWYPEPGQLRRCAESHFELEHEVDGTHDYLLTSEYWVRRLKWSLALNPHVWQMVAGKIWAEPRAAIEMLRLHLRDEAWVWQFREQAPMRLLRQTWVAK